MTKLSISKTSKSQLSESLLTVNVERDSLPGEYPYRIELVDGTLWIGEERASLIILRNPLRGAQR